MPRYQLTFTFRVVIEPDTNRTEIAHLTRSPLTLPARTGIWKVLEFVSFYWERHPFESVEIAHVA